MTTTVLGLGILVLVSAACAQLELGVLTQLYYPPPPAVAPASTTQPPATHQYRRSTHPLPAAGAAGGWYSPASGV